MSPKRSRLEKDRVLKCVQIKMSINEQLQKEQESCGLEPTRIESHKKLIDSALCASDEEIEKYIDGSHMVPVQD